MGWCQRPTKSGSATCEDEAFWKHLELAEIWTDFSPKNQSCNGGNKEGVLELPFNGAYINPMSHNQTVYYNNHCVNNFYIGDPLISANNMYASEGVLTPIEAFKIDKKFDDGVSSSGKLMAASARNTNATDGCSSIAVNSLGRFAAGVGTSDYLKENEGKLCRMFYFSDVFK
jgi:hypothetical protein